MRSLPQASPRASGHSDGDTRAVLPEGTAVPGQVPAEIFAAAVDAFTSGQRLIAVHAGTAGALENLIDLERRRGSFDASIDTPTLAYAIVRLSEGFLYADVIAARTPGIDRAPDIDRAITLIEALLLGLDLSSSPAPRPASRCSPR
jgi:hypothetical protein